MTYTDKQRAKHRADIQASLERENAYFMAHMDESDGPVACHEEGHVFGCPGAAGGDHEIDSAPDPEWFEDEEGYVKAPLSYENREGDPTFNGAFDKW